MKPDLEQLERLERLSIPEPNSGCWLWLGSANPNPSGALYGNLSINGRSVRAHRYSYSIHKGPIPDGLYVCHHCDNSLCVNPDHLFVGTHLDNMRDRETKGRNSPPPIYHGEKAPWAKLTDAQVEFIRTSDLPSVKVAALLGIKSDSYVRQIRRGVWRVPAPPVAEPKAKE